MAITFKIPYLYKKQKEFVFAEERFTIVEASTKSGKTIGCLVWIFLEALKGKDGDNCWWVAPVYTQSKIAYGRLKRYLRNTHFCKFNDGELSIKIKTGVTIIFKSGDNPDSLFGDDVIAAVIDEATRCKKEVWYAIRTTLTATGGHCKIIGNVKGKSNWVYELARKAEKMEMPHWRYFRLTAFDAIRGGVFPRGELEEARATLPDAIFNELYMAEPLDDRGKPFIWAFDEKTCVIKRTDFKIDETLPIHLSFDFNVDPITCTANQYSKNKQSIVTFEEFKLPNSDIYELCEQIKTRLMENNRIFIINGDASGKNSSAMVKGHLNYFVIIQQLLRVPPQFIQVPGANPSQSNSRLLTNSLFARHPFCKVTDNCVNVINDLKYCQTDEFGGLLKDRNSVYGKADLLDTIRYFHWTNFFDFIKKHLYD